jgi:hypothetical protein
MKQYPELECATLSLSTNLYDTGSTKYMANNTGDQNNGSCTYYEHSALFLIFSDCDKS